MCSSFCKIVVLYCFLTHVDTLCSKDVAQPAKPENPFNTHCISEEEH